MGSPNFKIKERFTSHKSNYQLPTDDLNDVPEESQPDEHSYEINNSLIRGRHNTNNMKVLESSASKKLA